MPISRSTLPFSRISIARLRGLSARAAERFLKAKARGRQWIEAAVAYYAAATLYEQLSRLSDAELRHRGLSRAGLAQDVADRFTQ